VSDDLRIQMVRLQAEQVVLTEVVARLLAAGGERGQFDLGSLHAALIQHLTETVAAVMPDGGSHPLETTLHGCADRLFFSAMNLQKSARPPDPANQG